MNKLFSLCLLVSTLAFADPEMYNIQMQTGNNFTYYVNSSIEGAGSTSFLVDTGAGYSIITKTTLRPLQKNGHAVYLRKLQGVMADGSLTKVSLYRISSINLGETCRINNIEVAVFPDGNREILGLNALSKVAPFTFSMNPPLLSLSHCDKV